MDFDKIVDYDNRCFVSANFPPRRSFLRLLVDTPGVTAYVAVDNITGDVVGLGCRRTAVQPLNHMVGPLYADNLRIAESLLAELCRDVAGEDVTIIVWLVS
jgi:hypothetical protein